MFVRIFKQTSVAEVVLIHLDHELFIDISEDSTVHPVWYKPAQRVIIVRAKQIFPLNFTSVRAASGQSSH